MRSMIDGLLKYSRVETQGDPLETVDLEHILDDVRENLQVTIEENDVMIEAEPLPACSGRPRPIATGVPEPARQRHRV